MLRNCIQKNEIINIQKSVCKSEPRRYLKGEGKKDAANSETRINFSKAQLIKYNSNFLNTAMNLKC